MAFLRSHAKPEFWPPCPSRFWMTLLAPWRWFYARREYRVTSIDLSDAEKVWPTLGPGDSVLLAPNHSDYSDAYVMIEASRQLRRQFYFMAACEIFPAHAGLDGWLLQRHGAFSVDREGFDRRSIRQGIELLTRGCNLVVFPEGRVSHLNDRLRPLNDGVAFLALSAQHHLQTARKETRVWIVPTFIHYRYLDDVLPQLEATMSRLEERVFIKAPPGASLAQRIVHFAELVLTIKEKESLGHSFENDGNLATRMVRLRDTILKRLEEKYLRHVPNETVAHRVKVLRRRLTDLLHETPGPETPRELKDAFDDLALVVQADGYPGDYLAREPSVERLAETLAKFEEDISGKPGRPKGKRQANVTFGEPFRVESFIAAHDVKHAHSHLRTAAAEITGHLEHAIQQLMNAHHQTGTKAAA